LIAAGAARRLPELAWQLNNYPSPIGAVVTARIEPGCPHPIEVFKSWASAAGMSDLAQCPAAHGPDGTFDLVACREMGSVLVVLEATGVPGRQG
jgi:hypothetical protein